MTWHTSTTTSGEELDTLIAHIRHHRGTVASCFRCDAGLEVTWFTL